MFNMSTADLQNHNERFDHALMRPTVTEEDEGYNHDNRSETSSKCSNAKSKMFQCTGYGDCRMVFTRSEHLARHMRKHTGEKPFQCVVPGCERMFSRFDNMMQHTQTHNKARAPRRNKAATKGKRGGKKSSNMRRSASDYDEYGPLPSPPPSRRGSSNNIVKEHQIILPNPKYLEVDEDVDELLSSDEDYEQKQKLSYKFSSSSSSRLFHSSMSRFPDSPASSDSSAQDYFPVQSRRRSAPQVRYQPYPYNQYNTYQQQQQQQQSTQHREVMPTIPRRNSALSQLATYLVDHPDQSPESYLTNRFYQSNPLPQPLPPRLPTRRLSIQDLSNPIDKLDTIHKKQEQEQQEQQRQCQQKQLYQSQQQKLEEGVDLTEDEYQAIQGFGEFHKTAVTCNNK